ncbi:MAG: hydroxymethylbilane synthase [Planctomycetaceae bacterium]|nr:hydroxymethylbilane synthase [Planctomycetaceae bacterium]
MKHLLPPVRLGTRGSVLARWQANWIAAQLQARGERVEIVVIQTSGDAIQHESIVNIGAQGVFTKEIQRALLKNQIDIAVHSAKDLPTEEVAGLQLTAVPERDSFRDVFISRIAGHIEQLPAGSRIGTGSMRRKTQILHHFCNKYRVEDIRGNVETRLRKLECGDYDALILAEAGLTRLGFADKICSVLEPPMFLPAVGQGALGLEIRSGDKRMTDLLQPFNHLPSFSAVLAERAMLRKLQGGCSAPIAALGTAAENTLTLHGRVLTPDGSKQYDVILSAPLSGDPETLGIDVADQLFRQMYPLSG